MNQIELAVIYSYKLKAAELIRKTRHLIRQEKINFLKYVVFHRMASFREKVQKRTKQNILRGERKRRLYPYKSQAHLILRTVQIQRIPLSNFSQVPLTFLHQWGGNRGNFLQHFLSQTNCHCPYVYIHNKVDLSEFVSLSKTRPKQYIA